jgi:hypothetical protein
MTAPIPHSQIEDEFLARVTDIAYQALLRRGLPGSFLDVQLGLWEDIRSAYHERRPAALEEAR